MSEVENFVRQVLQDEPAIIHYASKYYDPVKAREYYLRNRELKGRQLSGTTDIKLNNKSVPITAESRQKQSEASAYVRNNISNLKEKELEKQTNDTLAKVQAMQEKANAVQLEITNKFSDLVKSIQAKHEAKINKIPANASPKLREFLERQNSKIIESTNKEVAKAQKNAKVTYRAVGMELKTAVANVKEAYSTARKAIIEKYSLDLKTELQNITEQVR